MVLANGNCDNAATMKRIIMCRNMGCIEYTMPDARDYVTFPDILVYAKCKWKPPFANVDVWFNAKSFSSADVADVSRHINRGMRSARCVQEKHVEHINHSSRFYCGPYARNTTWDPSMQDTQMSGRTTLIDKGYAPAHCVRWNFNNTEDAMAFVDRLAGTMRLMEFKRCVSCSCKISCRVGNACEKCHTAAVKIQTAFRRAIADPNHDMCRRRLIREAGEINEDINDALLYHKYLPVA